MHPTKGLWILLIIAALAGFFVIGFTVGSSTSTVSVAPGSAGYQAGYDAARQKLKDSGALPTPAEIKTVTGIVTVIAGANLTIQAYPVSANPLEPAGPEVRTVTVSDAAAIVELVPLSDIEFRVALAAFNKQTIAGKQMTPPTPFREASLKLSDVRVGSTITVTSATDIRDAASITATKITVSR
jgi:hypothetical protein